MSHDKIFVGWKIWILSAILQWEKNQTYKNSLYVGTSILLRNGNKLMSIQRKDKKNQTELVVRKFKQVSDRTFGSHIKHNNHYCIIYKKFRDNDLDVQQRNGQQQQPWQDNYLTA